MLWWLPLASVVPAFFLWILVHESSHALSAVVTGAKIESFKPWPHKFDGKFRFGGVGYSKPSTTFTSLFPYVVDVVAFIGFFAAFFFVPTGWPKSLFVTLLACPTVNTVVAVQARFRGNESSDLGKVHWGWAIPFYYVVLAYLLVWGWRIVPWLVGGLRG